MIDYINCIEQIEAEPSGASPLQVLNERVVYREEGGADYTVEKIEAKVKASGQHVQFHVASVKQGKTGAICVAYHHIGDAAYILLGRHWRPSLTMWEWEFPRGMGEQGEAVEETAVREFREETGIVVAVSEAHIRQIVHADTCMLRDRIAVVTLDCENNPSAQTDWELSVLHWVSVPVFEQMIQQGMIHDGLTLAAWSVVTALAHK